MSPSSTVVAGHAVGDGLRDRVRLLVDLLEHEGLVAALLGGVLVPVDLLDLALLLGAAEGSRKRVPCGGHDDDLVVLDQLHAARLGQEGGDRRGDEALAVADAHHQRALLARADEHLGLVGATWRRRRSGRAARRRRRAPPRSGRRRSGGRSGGRRPRRRSRSVKLAPSARSRSRSSVQFSTMPLSTMCTRRELSSCGWAFASVTRPCVAQRVWPMPVVAVGKWPFTRAATASRQVLRDCRRHARSRSSRW